MNTMRKSFRVLSLILMLILGLEAKAGDEFVFNVINASNGLADNSAQVVTCTKTGRMIISTLGNINFYDGATFIHTDTRKEYKYTLQDYRGNYHLYFDNNHHLWLKDRNSVTCVDLMTETFIANVDSVFKTFGCHDTVNDLFVDTLGNLWLLTKHGLYGTTQKKYYPVSQKRNLQDLEVYGNLLLLFYDNGEEVAFNLDTRQIVHITKAYGSEEAAQYGNTSVLLRYKHGVFQIRNGDDKSILMFFDIDKRKWSIIMQMDYHLNNMALRDDELFIASAYGYWKYNIRTKEKTHVAKLKLMDGRELETDINTLAFDRQDGLWFGTEKRGLLYAHSSIIPFNAMTWDNQLAIQYGTMMEKLEQNIREFQGIPANCMYKDSRGWTWYGTKTGLYLVKSDKEKARLFSKRDGFYNEVIHSVIEDKNHNIWASTSCGITCIIFEGQEPVFINSFSSSDGVPAESFINCKSMRLDDGTIVMQALDHVVTFNPDSFKISNKRMTDNLLYPKLVRIIANGNFVKPGVAYDGNVIIDRAISRTEDIKLNSDQHSLSLIFSSLNYFRPLQSYYRVRIEGLDDTWRVFSYYDENQMVDEQGMLHLPLVDLAPGDYKLEVQVSMFPDVWESEPYAWYIHVNQPWWQTTGLYVILGILVLALLVANFIFFSRNMKMRVRRANEEGDVIRKISAFVERVNAFENEMLSPRSDNYFMEEQDSDKKLSPEFISLMTQLLPYIQRHANDELTMRQLSEAANMDVVQFYETVTDNLYKSPRELIFNIRLEKAKKQLLSTSDSIEKIAKDNGFWSPNYFIGNFYHKFKMLPEVLRQEQQK